MIAGDVVQAHGGSSGAGKITTVVMSLNQAPAPGNTVLVAFSADSVPSTVPEGFTPVFDPGGNFIYQSTTATGTSWTWIFPNTGACAWVASEHVGTASYSNGAYTTSTGMSTASAGPSIASTAADVLLDYCYVGASGTPGAVTAWSDGYTSVGNSTPTQVSGGFNFQVGAATKRSTGAASSTVATLSAASYWTHFQIAAHFSDTPVDTPPTGVAPTMFRIDAGGVLVPVSMTPLV